MEYTHESIFRSSLRAFAKAFFVILGIFVAFLPIMIAMSILGGSSQDMDRYTVTVLPDLKGEQKYLPLTTPAILRIDVKGVIGMKSLNTEDVYTQLIESRRGLLKDNRVKGILLYIASPGGSVNDSDGIYRLIKEYKEKYKVPVYTYIDGLCASGGMYIACSSDKIISNPVSVVGSVGVLIGPFFNFFDGMEKLGVNSLTLTNGKGKDSLSMFRKWKPGEDEALKNIGNALYQDFVDIVAQARPMLNKQKLINEYGAQIFDAKTAKEYGYIDEANGSYEGVLKELLTKANIDTEKPYQVVRLTPKKDWFSYIAENKENLLSGKIRHTVQLGPYDLSSLKDPFAYIYLPAARDH